MQPAILIHGPTASGKSALAAAVAKNIGGEVVNADSMQVYRDLTILTARPNEDDMGGVPHHLFGHVDAATRYSTGKWLDDVSAIMRDIEHRGKIPVLVGGTGLYFLALTAGLSEIPPVPEDIRADVRTIAAEEGGAGLKARLSEVDPESARRLAEGDRQRLSRAYEVWLATGKPFSAFTGNRKPPLLSDGEWLGVALTPPRSVLYGRIEARFDAMMTNGAMDEAKVLVERQIDPELPVMKAHGMPWLASYIRGDVSSEFAIQNAKRDTRRYAKRQFTWIGRQFPFWPRIPSIDAQTREKVIFALYGDIDGA
ncbi:MAG: tRNA (adenosine(37)-N6)-dimethylallyltransferase MiaA [Pseudomonadota bacterium]